MTKTFDDKRPVELANTDSHMLRDEILSFPGGSTNGAMAAAFAVRQLASWLVDAQSKNEALHSAFKHNEEWWKTYRAALSGLVTRDRDFIFKHEGYEMEGMRMSTLTAHSLATEQANMAHGPLRDLSLKENVPSAPAL